MLELTPLHHLTTLPPHHLPTSLPHRLTASPPHNLPISSRQLPVFLRGEAPPPEWPGAPQPDPTLVFHVATLNSNLSASFLALEKYVEGSHHASIACELEPTNWKGWWRHGLALLMLTPSMKRLERAATCFQVSLSEQTTVPPAVCHAPPSRCPRAAFATPRHGPEPRSGRHATLATPPSPPHPSPLPSPSATLADARRPTPDAREASARLRGSRLSPRVRARGDEGQDQARAAQCREEHPRA